MEIFLFLLLCVVFLYLLAAYGLVLFIEIPKAFLKLIIWDAKRVTDSRVESSRRAQKPGNEPKRPLSAKQRASIERDIREKERIIKERKW